MIPMSVVRAGSDRTDDGVGAVEDRGESGDAPLDLFFDYQVSGVQSALGSCSAAVVDLHDRGWAVRHHSRHAGEGQDAGCDRRRRNHGGSHDVVRADRAEYAFVDRCVTGPATGGCGRRGCPASACCRRSTGCGLRRFRWFGRRGRRDLIGDKRQLVRCRNVDLVDHGERECGCCHRHRRLRHRACDVQPRFY